MNTEQYVSWFRSTSPYINSNRGKTFVLALGGEVLAHENFTVLLQDIVLLHSLGVKVVLCFGADQQIEQALHSTGSSVTKESGRLIPGEQAVNIAAATFGEWRSRIEAVLLKNSSTAQHRGTPLRTISGSFITAKPFGVDNGVDHEHAGAVRNVDVHGVQAQLDQGNVVLIPAIAPSPSGELFSLDDMELGRELAARLGADKLILFSENDGILDDGQLLRELSLAQARELANSNVDSNLSCAIKACEAGVDRTQIVSFTNSSALLTELFSLNGSGTLISRDPFELIRDANIHDISAVLDLIAPLENDGTLVRRSREKLEEEIEFFAVIERDGKAIACAALYPFVDASSAELACVVTEQEFRNSGRAVKLLQHAISKAQSQGLSRLFVLTTKAAHWFQENGFEETGIETLPVSRQTLYNNQRNSKVLMREL
ncbi:MAG: amino-acid N-acetyltransferase [Pseudomonadales bacterium]